jgi:hypothetical protein
VRSARYPAALPPVLLDLRRVCLGLGYLGAKPAGRRLRDRSQILTFWYFAHFPDRAALLSRYEKTKPLPNSISESVLKSGAPAKV